MREPASNQEWIFWGRHDPLYAVSTQAGRELGSPEAWSAAEFFESGRCYFADVQRQWEQYGMGSNRCVEIGCGTGRITRQLASCFRHVTAFDVSPGQLQTARRLLEKVVHNVEFTLVSTPHLPVDDGVCDGVFSCEVFQHLDPALPILRDYISEAYRVLADGGTFCFQVPVRGIQSASILASPARNRLLSVLRLLGRRRMMIYQQFSAPIVLGLLSESGFSDVQIRVFHARGRRITTATSWPVAVRRANPDAERLRVWHDPNCQPRGSGAAS